MPKHKKEHKKLAISMSGGGAKAMCYLGFVRVLEEEGIKISMQAVQSGAAILLCYLSSGMSDEEIIKEFSKFKFIKHFAWNPFKNGGLVSPVRLERFLRKVSNNIDINKIHPQTLVTVSDLTNWDYPKKKVISNGSLARYATMSANVVPLMPVVRYNDKIYTDAGYTSVYNVEELKSMGAEVVIGLHPDALKDTKFPELYWNTAIVIKSMMKQVENMERSKFDVDFEIRDFGVNVGLQEFSKADIMYEGGRETAKKMLPKIKELIKFSK